MLRIFDPLYWRLVKERPELRMVYLELGPPRFAHRDPEDVWLLPLEPAPELADNRIVKALVDDGHDIQLTRLRVPAQTCVNDAALASMSRLCRCARDPGPRGRRTAPE